MDAFNDYGTDLVIGAGGDLLSVDGTDETRQRALRRILTPVGGYLWNLDYGAGVPLRVGENASADTIGAIKSDILAACGLETGIAQFPAPEVAIEVIDSGLSGNVTYFDAETKTPQVIYFPVA